MLANVANLGLRQGSYVEGCKQVRRQFLLSQTVASVCKTVVSVSVCKTVVNVCKTVVSHYKRL